METPAGVLETAEEGQSDCRLEGRVVGALSLVLGVIFARPPARVLRAGLEFNPSVSGVGSSSLFSLASRASWVYIRPGMLT